MKPVPSYPGYFAGEDGHVYRNGTLRKPISNGRGYLRIKTSINNVQKDAYVHRMVCEAYHGPCPPDHECRHLDGSRSNNVPSNLEWATKAVNEADKVRHGTLNWGERNGLSVLTEETVTIARARAAAGEQVKQIATDLGIAANVLANAVRGKTWHRLPGALGNYFTRRKFSDDQVIAVRAKAAQGWFHDDLAAEWGVTQTAISALIRGETYAHVSEGIRPGSRGGNRRSRIRPGQPLGPDLGSGCLEPRMNKSERR